MKSKNSGVSEAGRDPRRVSVVNRKYLGSKRELAPAILEKIRATSGVPEVFFDGFLGTGAVSAAIIAAGARSVIVCDNLYSNTAVFRGAFALPAGEAHAVERARDELNRLAGRAGYITEQFADRYFTRDNCLVMDAVREELERRKAAGEILESVAGALLASFILGADRVANTIGQYDAYMKHLGKPGVENGRHLVDVRVYDRFTLPPLETLPPVEREIYTTDVLAVLDRVRADTAYLDPPYNGRQYCDNYHVLENLARWEKPRLAGLTRKFDRSGLKSVFSRRRTAAAALKRLLDGLRVRHVYLSYNSEGILSKEDIEEAIGKDRLRTRWDFPYPVFGRGAGVSRRRTVIEYLFYLQNDVRT